MEWNGMEWNKKVLVSYTHNYIPYLIIPPGCYVSSACLLTAFKRHLALVITRSDEFVFAFGCHT